MYVDTFRKYKDEEITKAFSSFQSFKEECEAQINSIKMRKQGLKAELKNGSINSNDYQRALTPLNKQIEDLNYEISTKKYDLINKYRSEGISCKIIESYMNKKNNI